MVGGFAASQAALRSRQQEIEQQQAMKGAILSSNFARLEAILQGAYHWNSVSPSDMINEILYLMPEPSWPPDLNERFEVSLQTMLLRLEQEQVGLIDISPIVISSAVVLQRFLCLSRGKIKPNSVLEIDLTGNQDIDSFDEVNFHLLAWQVTEALQAGKLKNYCLEIQISDKFPLLTESVFASLQSSGQSQSLHIHWQDEALSLQTAAAMASALSERRCPPNMSWFIDFELPLDELSGYNSVSLQLILDELQHGPSGLRFRVFNDDHTQSGFNEDVYTSPYYHVLTSESLPPNLWLRLEGIEEGDRVFGRSALPQLINKITRPNGLTLDIAIHEEHVAGLKEEKHVDFGDLFQPGWITALQQYQNLHHLTLIFSIEKTDDEQIARIVNNTRSSDRLRQQLMTCLQLKLGLTVWFATYDPDTRSYDYTATPEWLAEINRLNQLLRDFRRPQKPIMMFAETDGTRQLITDVLGVINVDVPEMAADPMRCLAALQQPAANAARLLAWLEHPERPLHPGQDADDHLWLVQQLNSRLRPRLDEIFRPTAGVATVPQHSDNTESGPPLKRPRCGERA